MKGVVFTLVAGLTIAFSVIPQDFPPGALLLARVQQHVKQELQRLPNISCLETVQRDHQAPKGKMRPVDTVRLEVLTNGVKELYASPGDRKFSEEHPITYTGSGTIGDGFFGLYLRTVVVNGNVTIVYKGEEDKNGRHVARYDYRLPQMWSGQRINMAEGSGVVGLRGSFWVDPQTFDVVRLELNAEDFPPSLPLNEAVTSINYARTSLGEDVNALLPESAEFHMVNFRGEVNRNHITFTGCRIFGAQSAISFDDPGGVEARAAEASPTDAGPAEPEHFGASSIDDTLRPLPAGLEITVRLRTRISGDAAVGALIDGTVAVNVRKQGETVIPAGAPVRGRIRRLERYSEPVPHYVVALEFTEVELHGIRHRFHADLVDIEPAPGVEQRLAARDQMQTAGAGRMVRNVETITLTSLPGVAAFFYKGEKLNLQPGLRTVWKTIAVP